MANMFDSISEPLARRVTAGLAKIALVLRSRAWKGAGPVGLTPTQGQALALLRESPEGMRLTALAQLLGVSAPTASDAVSSLVAKGLVEKAAGPDRRSIALKLTAAGKTTAGCTDEWPDFLVTAIDKLPLDQQATLLRSLIEVVRTLQESGDIPLQRMCVTCKYFRPNLHSDPQNPHHCAFVDASFGDRHLRLNCQDYDLAAGSPSHGRDAANR